MLIFWRQMHSMNNNNNNRFTALCPGLPGWAGTRRNTHPPTILIIILNLYQLLPSATIHSILPVQITCLAIFLHNLFPCSLWSTSWSRALHLIFYVVLPIYKGKGDPVECGSYRGIKLLEHAMHSMKWHILWMQVMVQHICEFFVMKWSVWLQVSVLSSDAGLLVCFVSLMKIIGRILIEHFSSDWM